MNMKKQILIFGIFCLGLLTSLWICAQTENTISENTEKNSGDQLIEFLQNLPSKYELGVESRLAGFNSSNPYYKIKRNDSNFFYGRGSNSSFITSSNINDWDSFCIVCNNGNEYWRYNGQKLSSLRENYQEDEEQDQIV